MDWNDIHHFFASRMPNSNAKQWAHDVTTDNDESQRLAVCLAIELKHDLIKKQHWDIIFENCDYDSASMDSRNWFAKRLDDVMHRIKKPGGCVVESTETENSSAVIVNLLSFYRLYKHYLKELDAFSSVDLTNEDDMVDFIRSNPYILNELPYFGYYNKNVVWVTPLQELDRIRTAATGYSVPSCYLNDLGLTPDGEGISEFPEVCKMYFLVEYPASFAGTLYQPTSLNKNWKNVKKDIFLSYIKLDKSGRTYATDGCLREAKEQIHEPTPCKNLNFKVVYAGKHDDMLPFDKSKLVNEGIKRANL